MVLFDPDMHEPLTGAEWNDLRSRSAIEQIVTRTVDGYQPGRFWPRHPSDDYGSRAIQDKGLWIGAASVDEHPRRARTSDIS